MYKKLIAILYEKSWLIRTYMYLYDLTPCMLGNFSCFFCRLLLIIKISSFKKLFQEHYQSVETVWIQIRINHLSVLIWVQTVCKYVISRRQKILLGTLYRPYCQRVWIQIKTNGPELDSTCLQRLSADDKICHF